MPSKLTWKVAILTYYISRGKQVWKVKDVACNLDNKTATKIKDVYKRIGFSAITTVDF